MPRTSLLLVAALVAVSTLAAFAPPTGADATLATPPPCEGYRDVPFQGPSCPLPNGLWRVLLPDGSTVDTHGPDRADGRLSPGGTGAKASAPACVTDPSSQFHGVVVYAHAADKPDRSAEMTPLLRNVVDQANGFLRQEAQELGHTARYKMRCDSGSAVTVLVARMPRDDANVSFATLISDLRTMGHSSPYAKYWVWYDGTRGDLYGQGQVYPNDKLTSNNGNAKGNGFSVVWGLLDPMAFVHETSHTMGAVQATAPHTSGAWHCTDGLDVMCYFDSPESAYNASACSDRIHLDCGHDDYFHPAPGAGSYLASHWNMAHRYNRFLDLGRANEAPSILPITCAPAVVDFDEPATCRVFADDDSDGVAYWVGLDGGAMQRYPATGWMIAGNALSLAASWPAPGEHTWRVVAFDDAKKALSSNAASVTVRVGCALERNGNLTAGLAGTPEETSSMREDRIPRACSGAPYRLSGSFGADVDVCWYDTAGVKLSCGTALGDETGAIPAGARAARVYLKAGATATYGLKAG